VFSKKTMLLEEGVLLANSFSDEWLIVA